MEWRSKRLNSKKAYLIGTSGEFTGERIELNGKLRLGRKDDNDVCFSGTTVSGYHAEILKNGDGFEIHDMGSKNRTKINGNLIYRPTTLSHEDSIKIGKNSFNFDMPSAAKSKRKRDTAPVRKETLKVTEELPPNIESTHTEKISYDFFKKHYMDDDQIILHEETGKTKSINLCLKPIIALTTNH